MAIYTDPGERLGPTGQPELTPEQAAGLAERLATDPEFRASWRAKLHTFGKYGFAAVLAAMGIFTLGEVSSGFSSLLSTIGNAVAEVAARLGRFFRTLYDRVLRPAWQKFWRLVDRTRRRLERIFRPVLKVLRAVRREILKFYAKWIRPVLDAMDAIRRALRVIGFLGAEWAKALDQKIAELEERIQRPFDLILRKVNEVIGIVNRIVTADGLFQRLTLLRSMTRDAYDAFGTLVNEFDKPVTDEGLNALRALATARSIDDVRADAQTYFRTEGGPLAARVDALVRVMRPHLAAR